MHFLAIWRRTGTYFDKLIELVMRRGYTAVTKAASAEVAKCTTRMSLLFTSGGKPHQEPHCIAGKLSPRRLSDIQECCPDPRRRPGNAALRLYHTCARCCAPMQHIFWKVLLFGGTRACCLPTPAPRCTVFEVLCHKLTQLQLCFSLEQHRSERQKSAWQQREGTRD